MMNLAILVFAAVLVAASAVDTRTETTCQTHKRNTGGNAPVQWDIRCDEQGNYEPLQCTKGKPKWCSCYNKEEAVTSPSKSTRYCKCPVEKDAAIKNAASACETPTCQRDGKYEKKQCCATTGKCHCVDEITGEKRTQPTTNQSVKC
ncbi:U24-ctenitoxin-Pn1a-like [Uloborus diversus]|uniref:U24-ctenitoxin-Pn1a-like n=1 Tax=Uloborus diversus TaxID=327109 RepID=UPI002409C531|nr:U24-ctenitoxin-Pn1a-like [Uloborus diversus]